MRVAVNYFYSMSKEYRVEPMSDHCACIVDLLGRYGCLDEAKNLVDSKYMVTLS